jgi:hypothetical protein
VVKLNAGGTTLRGKLVHFSVEARCVAMEATLRHDLLQSEVEALEGRWPAGISFEDALQPVQILLH